MKPPRFTREDIAALESGLARRQAEIDAQWQLVERLMAAAFDGQRDPRSDAYKAGVRDTLAFKLCGKQKIQPYALGTPHADAWWAGGTEAMSILMLRLARQAVPV